jgi:hypothetical protein
MKIQCKCGEHVIGSSASQKYRWTRQEDWERLLDAVDSEIEKVDSDESKEKAIMAIRYSEKSTEVWECPTCRRLITFNNSQVVYLTVEKT